jgi:hypothetical protein
LIDLFFSLSMAASPSSSPTRCCCCSSRFRNLNTSWGTSGFPTAAVPTVLRVWWGLPLWPRTAWSSITIFYIPRPKNWRKRRSPKSSVTGSRPVGRSAAVGVSWSQRERNFCDLDPRCGPRRGRTLRWDPRAWCRGSARYRLLCAALRRRIRGIVVRTPWASFILRRGVDRYVWGRYRRVRIRGRLAWLFFVRNGRGERVGWTCRFASRLLSPIIQ